MIDKPLSEVELLASINAKLGALLAITIDDYVRSHNIDGAKPVPIEKMLTDAGLSRTEAATLLGKTAEAVRQALTKTSAKKKAPVKKAKK